jgi:hypothetical protein
VSEERVLRAGLQEPAAVANEWTAPDAIPFSGRDDI